MGNRYQITLDDEVAREFEELARTYQTSVAIEIRRFLTERYRHLRDQEEALKVAERIMVRHEDLFRRLAR
jgi:rRNA-processing protein FCF1